jgi:hypothetical protein
MARIERQHRHPGDAQRIGDDRAVDRRGDRQPDAQQRRERLLDGRDSTGAKTAPAPKPDGGVAPSSAPGRKTTSSCVSETYDVM